MRLTTEDIVKSILDEGSTELIRQGCKLAYTFEHGQLQIDIPDEEYTRTSILLLDFLLKQLVIAKKINIRCGQDFERVQDKYSRLLYPDTTGQ